jgi:hypothetical protein
VPRAGSLDLLRDTHVEGASAPPELGRLAESFDPPRRPGRVLPTDATHIFKDEHPCAPQPTAYPRQSRERPPDRRFNDAEPASTGGLAAPGSVVDSLKRAQSPGSDAPSPAPVLPQRITRRLHQTPTKTFATTAPLSAMAFAARDAFRRSGALVEPLADPRAPWRTGPTA